MIKDECFTCCYARVVSDPLYRCIKPWEGIHGLTQAVKKGLFIYPIQFDPRFRKGKKPCINYERDTSRLDAKASCKFPNLP